MKKHQKILNLLIIITTICSILALTRIECFAQNNLISQSQQETVQQQNDPAEQINAPKSIPEKNAYELTHMKKSGFKYVMLKFFFAMIGVLISAFAILLGLKIYKKFVLKNDAKFDTINYDKTLESPKDFKEAINLFLEKTDK